MNAHYQLSSRNATITHVETSYQYVGNPKCMSLAQNLRKFREEADLSQEQLAKLAGCSQQAIANLENGTTLSSKFIFAIANALKKGVSDLDPSIPRQTVLAHLSPSPVLKGADLPVYAAAEGGADGSVIITYDPIEFIDRPSLLLGVRDAYGIYIVGDSMEPAYSRGDLVWINPTKVPRAPADAVIFQEAETQVTALIKRLVGVTATEWQVKQHNPQKVFKLPRAKWGKCHMVVGKINAS